MGTSTRRLLSSILLWFMGTMILANIVPIFPFYVPLVAMVAMLPAMWIKFKVPAGRGQGTEEYLGIAAGATVDAGPVAD